MRLAFDYVASQLRRIDVAMIAAAIVEVPRWYVAFAAIKEPWWAAVPMGILLAWGASAGWKAYFADRRRWLLLAINVTSLAGALIVIAPVLYAMTFTPLDEINLALVMSQELLMAWAATLAITTFIPLVQIAAVKMYASSAAPDPAQDATPTVQRRKRNVEPDDAGATQFIAPVRIVMQADADEAQQSDAAPQKPAQTSATSAQPDAGAAQRRRKSDAELRRAQIAQLRIDSAAEIAHQFGVSLRTAQADLAAVRSATTQRNGAVH